MQEPLSQLSGGDRRRLQPHDLLHAVALRLAWLVDAAGAVHSADHFLASLGAQLIADGLPLAGGALTLTARTRSSPAAPGCGRRKPEW